MLGGLLARAVAQRSSAAPDGPILARKWHPSPPGALPEPHDHPALVADVKSYEELPEGADVTVSQALLAAIVERGTAAREAESVKLRSATEERDRLKTIAARTESDERLLAAAEKEVLRLHKLWKAIAATGTAALVEDDVVRYQVQRTATAAAFETDVPKYLNITPDAGGHALATGGKGRYGSDIALEQQYRLTTSDLGGLKVHDAGGVIELLVLSGGHGGVGSTFESAEGAQLDADWWKAQIQALVDKKVTAKLIVLDACLTASMVPAFVPALAPGGKIVGYVHSIPQMTMTADLWAKVAGKPPEQIESSIDERLRQLVQEHAASRHETSLGATIAVAVYRDDTKTLHYDASAVDEGVVAALPGHAGKEKSEITAMKRELVGQKAQAMTGFVPALKELKGAAVVEADKVVPAADWGDWLDDEWSPLKTSARPMTVGGSVFTNAGEEWQILEFEKGVSMKVKKP